MLDSTLARRIFTVLRNKPVIVREGPGYPRNGTSVDVSALRLVHRTMKCVIKELACWNCTRSMLYTVQTEKFGYGHKWVNGFVKFVLLMRYVICMHHTSMHCIYCFLLYVGLAIVTLPCTL